MRFIYRNRPDDDRTMDELYFCSHCGGYYGVPHDWNHCQDDAPGDPWQAQSCACRFCRESTVQPIQGTYGEFLPEVS